MVIKTLNESHADEMKNIFGYCFFGEDKQEEPTPEEMKNYFKRINSKCSLGYFDHDKLVSTYVVCNYDIFIREVLMKMAGVEGVATLPEYRRKRIISEITIQALKNMREEKLFISALYPFKYSFYRKYGYEICCQFKRIETKPGLILLPSNFQSLKIAEVSFEDAFEKIKAVREKDGKNYTYIMFSDVNQFKACEKHSKNTQIFIIEDNNRKIVGYFICLLRKVDNKIELLIGDYNIENEDAFLTILDYIKKHTDQIHTFRIPIHNENNVFDYFDDLNFDEISYISIGGAMFRVVDVEQALKLLKFPKELSFSFNLHVKDDYAPWNDEPMLIEIINGGMKISKKKSSSHIDLELDIKAFTQLFVGYRSIFDLYQAKKVSIKPNLLEFIDKVFPKRLTYTSTTF